MTTAKEIESITKCVAKANNITKYKYVITSADLMGIHYMGDLVPVTLHGQNSGEDITLYLIIKLPQVSETINREQIVRFMFAREIYVYSRLLPDYADMQSRFGYNQTLTIARCHYHRSDPPHERLVLQDMRPEGYRVFQENMFLDLDHVQVAIKEVAKLHALSFALEKTEPDKFAEHKMRCTRDMDVKPSFFDMVESSLARDMERMRNDSSRRALRRCVEVWRERSGGRAHGARVLAHSDLWRNNILFQYQGTKPVAACLLDFQIVQYTSPAKDILSLISTCTDYGTRRLHYDSLIRLYHNTIAGTLRQFSIEVSQVYPFEELQRDLVYCAPYCLMTSLFGLLTWYGVGGLHDMREDTDSGWRAVEGAGNGDLAVEYRKASDHLILDFVRYGYI